MSPESHTPHPPEHTSHTPESLQECYELSSALDAQVEEWCEISQSLHPSLQFQSMASIIVRDCTPIDQENNTVASINRLHQDAFEKAQHRERARRLKLIAATITVPDFDTTPPRDELYARFFTQLKEYTATEQVDEVLGDALSYLMRIYVVREHLSRRLQQESFDAHSIGHLLAVLVGDTGAR